MEGTETVKKEEWVGPRFWIGCDQLWASQGLLHVLAYMYIPGVQNVESMGAKVWQKEHFNPTKSKAFPQWWANMKRLVRVGHSGEPVLELRVGLLWTVHNSQRTSALNLNEPKGVSWLKQLSQLYLFKNCDQQIHLNQALLLKVWKEPDWKVHEDTEVGKVVLTLHVSR